MRLLILCTLIALASGHPGLLRVPKVYNAVVTSNQNLSPSRAFPVIQPVIHQTAVGYVPPLYYTQVIPQFSGPEVVHLPHIKGSLEPDEGDAGSTKSNESDGKVDARRGPEGNRGNSRDTPRRNKGEQVPLSFYPNYQSLHYDPYFYTYNGYNPHFVPGTYYVDYQPYGGPEPIPASTLTSGHSGHLLPGYHDEKKDTEINDGQKIPDVPPPPLPTARSKSS